MDTELEINRSQTKTDKTEDRKNNTHVIEMIRCEYARFAEVDDTH